MQSDGPLACLSGSAVKKPKSVGKAKARRTRSSSRRRKIRQELEIKAARAKDTWSLQQQLLNPGVSKSLLDAAHKLLAMDAYNAVVEERALEGVCGYPACSDACAGSVEGKKWTINARDCEVYSTEDVGRFCSLKCLRASGAFSVRLQPEPDYVRPGSAVAASRSAVAEACEQVRNGGIVEEIGRSNISDKFEAEAKELRVDDTVGEPAVAGKGVDVRPVPKVRQKAVVTFSRVQQTYKVSYDQYDGGGELPHETTAIGTPVTKSMPSAAVAQTGEKGGTTEEELTVPVRSSGTQVDAKRDTASGPHSYVEETIIPELDGDTADQVDGDASTEFGRALDSVSRDDANDSDEDLTEALFDADAVFPLDFSRSSFVRAWGVLSSWLTEGAKDAIRGLRRRSVLDVDDGFRPTHRGRRSLLAQILSDRLPGELAFLAPRLEHVNSHLGLHQSLPSVSEAKLYDLLAALLMRRVLVADVARGEVSENVDHSAILERLVQKAAKRLDLSAAELADLENMFAF